MSCFQKGDNTWTLVEILHIEINVNEYKPIRGISYILKKNSCVNIKNNDVYYSKWAIISGLCPVQKNTKKTSCNISPTSLQMLYYMQMIRIKLLLR